MARSLPRRLRARWLIGAIALTSAVLPLAHAADYPVEDPPREGEMAVDDCTWPLAGSVRTESAIATDIPDAVDTGTFTPPYAMTLDVAVDPRVLDVATLAQATSFAGTLTSHQRVVYPSGAAVHPAITTTIPMTAFPASDGTAPLVIQVAGSYPRVRLMVAGTVSWVEDDFILSLSLYDEHGLAIAGLGTRDDSDHDPMTFDVTCSRAAGARTVAVTRVGPAPPTPTPAPTPVPTATPKVWPVPAPRGPELTWTRSRVLAFSALSLERGARASCPRRVQVRIRPSGASRPSVTVPMPVRHAFAGCSVSGSLKLSRAFEGRLSLSVRIRGAHLFSVTRTVMSS